MVSKIVGANSMRFNIRGVMTFNIQVVPSQLFAVTESPREQEARSFSRPSTRCWALASRVVAATARFFTAVAHAFLEGYYRLIDAVVKPPRDPIEAAVAALYKSQRFVPLNSVEQAYAAFSEYLNHEASITPEKRMLAQNALFGLISGGSFSVGDRQISGRELIGRLWIFASRLTEQEQKNAKRSIISALNDSNTRNGTVCNRGKTQRLVVAVLQGRLAGVKIDIDNLEQVSKTQAQQMFFNITAHKNIAVLQELIDAANRFCDENPLVDRKEFLLEIRKYADLQDIT